MKKPPKVKVSRRQAGVAIHQAALPCDIARLTSTSQSILRMTYVDGHADSAIAKVLDLTVAGVNELRRNALVRLSRLDKSGLYAMTGHPDER